LSIAEVVIGETLKLAMLLLHNGDLLEARGFIPVIKATSSTRRDGGDIWCHTQQLELRKDE
jgi:hypothetical protein